MDTGAIDPDEVYPEEAVPEEIGERGLPSPATKPVVLVPTQAKALGRLMALGRAYFDGAWHDLPIQPRMIPLLVGPSGVGKSFLAQHLATKLSARFLRISFAEWQPLGARSVGSVHAFDRIYKLISESERAIIFIDEMEKMRGGLTQEWSLSIMQELFLLLDRSPSITTQRVAWEPQTMEGLQRRTFLLGGGTWQEAWTEIRRPGFRGSVEACSEAEIARRIESSNKIPAELLKRFDAGLVVVPHYSAEDFRQILASHNDQVGPELRIDVTPGLLEQLTATRRNMRAVQELIGERLIGLAGQRPEVSEGDIPF